MTEGAKFKPGDRVEMATTNHKGSVEFANDTHVRVKWDDGQIGLLYYDRNMMPSAHRLVPLLGEKEGQA